MASYSDCLEKAGLTIFSHDERPGDRNVTGDPFCEKCGYVKSHCVCDKTIGEFMESKTDEQDFIETLNTLKQWEWELVAEHMPLDLVRKRLEKELDRLAKFEEAIDTLCKIGTT